MAANERRTPLGGNDLSINESLRAHRFAKASVSCVSGDC